MSDPAAAERVRVVKEVTTSTARYWLGDDGIARCELMGVHDTEQAEENITAGQSILDEGVRVPLLVDSTRVEHLTRGARGRYTGERSASRTSAVAILIRSRIGEMLARFLMTLNTFHVPTKTFSSRAEALGWLKGFL